MASRLWTGSAAIFPRSRLHEMVRDKERAQSTALSNPGRLVPIGGKG